MIADVKPLVDAFLRIFAWVQDGEVSGSRCWKRGGITAIDMPRSPSGPFKHLTGDGIAAFYRPDSVHLFGYLCRIDLRAGTTPQSLIDLSENLEDNMTDKTLRHILSTENRAVDGDALIAKVVEAEKKYIRKTSERLALEFDVSAERAERGVRKLLALGLIDLSCWIDPEPDDRQSAAEPTLVQWPDPFVEDGSVVRF